MFFLLLLFLNGLKATNGSDDGEKSSAQGQRFLLAASSSVFISNGTYSPTNLSAPLGHSDNPFSGLQQALLNITDGTTIYVYPGRYSGEDNTELEVTKSIHIQGLEGYTSTIFDGQSSSWLFKVASVNVSFDGLNFANSYRDGNGPAMTIENANVEFSNCLFENNQGEADGALNVQSSWVNFWNCTFDSNSAGNGAAFVMEQTEANFSQCTFTNQQLHHFQWKETSSRKASLIQTG